MKVLLIAPDINKGFRPSLPFALAILTSELRMYNHEVQCIDLNVESDVQYVLEQSAKSFRPEIIGISIRNLDSQSILEPVFHLPNVRRLVTTCRGIFPHCKIVLGGASFSLIPEEIIQFVCADYGIIGPGEKSFPLLLARLAQNQCVDDIPGVIQFQIDDKVITRKPVESVNVFASSPYSANDIYDDRYFNKTYQTPTFVKEITEPIQSKRGCSYQCFYCSTSIKAQHPFKVKSPSRTVDEVQHTILNKRANRIEFVDAAFNMPVNHALEVCSEMYRRGIQFPWNCMISPGGFKKELIHLMAKTGCDYVEMGTETGSDKVLSAWGKNFNVSCIRRMHQMLDYYGIAIEHCVFIGGPNESKRTILNTFDLLDDLVPAQKKSKHRVFINIGFRIFPRTLLHKIAIREGVIKPNDLMAVPRFYVSPMLINDYTLIKEIEEFVAKHKNWYLWWGLGKYSLYDRLMESINENEEMINLYNRVFNN